MRGIKTDSAVVSPGRPRWHAGRPPSGWAETSLGEILYLILAKAEPSDDPDAPYIGLEHIESGSNRLCGIGKAVSVKSTKNVFSPGDILYGKLRPYLDKVFIADFSGICSTDILVLRPERGIEARFVEAILRTRTFIDFATQTSAGANLPRTTFRKIAQFPICVAPAQEQNRIATKLAHLRKREQKLQEMLGTVPGLMDEYGISVLKAACTGNLVQTEAAAAKKENRPYESARALLLRVDEPPEPDRYGTRNIEIVDTGHPALAIGKPSRSAPRGWVWVPLVRIARMASGHTPSRKHPEWWQGKIPWLGIADARERHGQTITNTARHINRLGLANSAARLLPKGTVCISRTASVGYVVVLARPMATSQDFINWTPTEAVLSEWLKLVFMADREALARFGKGAIHTTIYFPEWLSMYIALPPIFEQHRIVDETERRLSAIERIRREFNDALSQTVQLRAALFYSAISGQLVAQSPSDEPATVLLSRIYTDRKNRVKEIKRHKPRRKNHMTKLSPELVKRTIQQLRKDHFTFAELNTHVRTDYESLKDILFALLAEPKPCLKQVFDSKAREIQFRRAHS